MTTGKRPKRQFGWKVMGTARTMYRKDKRAPLRSIGGGTMEWRSRVWYSVAGRVTVCQNGLHCCPDPINCARIMRDYTVLALVEMKGTRHWHGKGTPIGHRKPTKSAWRSMRVIRAVRWGKGDWMRLARFLATLEAGPRRPALRSYQGNENRWFDYASDLFEWACEGYASTDSTKQRNINLRAVDAWVREYIKGKAEIR